MSRTTNQRLRIIADIAHSKAAEAQGQADVARSAVALAQLADRQQQEERQRQTLEEHRQYLREQREVSDRVWEEHKEWLNGQ